MSVESRKQRRLRREAKRQADAELKRRLAWARDARSLPTPADAMARITQALMIQDRVNQVIVPSPEDMLKRFKRKGRWT